MPSVKYAISAYVADGTTTDYLITWDYLDEDHIAVYVDGTSNADPTASHTFVQLNSTTLRITDNLGNAIVSGSEIEIRRETPLTTRAITFADGSALLAADLNKNSDYLLYSMQEVLDTVDAAAQDGALAAQVATELLRNEAEGFKDDAETAMNTTQGYLATVQSDATDADNHRIAAAASEAASAASEAAAAVSETNSANSATASAASAAASLASETAAAASELAAAASEVAAAASQVAAAASEANAATSEANAEAAWDSFDDRYLGAKASAPTVDNDGNALLTGALYWNSTGDQMYVWNGASWDTFNSTIGIADGASSTAVTIDANGNVGIGTSSPTHTLSVAKTTTGTNAVDVVNNTVGAGSSRLVLRNPNSDTNGNGFQIINNANDDVVNLLNYKNTDLALWTNAIERMRIDSSGNVGIGVASPTNRLELSNGTSATYFVQTRGDVQCFMGPTGSSVSNTALIGTLTNSPFEIRTNNIERMRIDNAGRVTMPYQPCGVLYNPNGSATDGRVVGFDSKTLLRGGVTAVTGSASRFTVASGGYFELNTVVGTSATSASIGDGIFINFRKNGSKIHGTNAHPIGNFGAQNGTEMIFCHTTIVALAANDYVDVYFDNVSSSATFNSGIFTIKSIG